MFSLAVSLLALLAADDASQVLRRMASTYEKLRSYEIAASLSFKVPDRDLIITTRQIDFYVSASMLPPDAPVPVIHYGTRGGPQTFRNSAGQDVTASLTYSIHGFPFSVLDVADTRVVAVRGLPDETLSIAGERTDCAVIEVSYDKRSPLGAGSGAPVRMWIDKRTSLLRQAKYQREWTEGAMATWTVTVERIIIDQPPPASAIERAAALKGRHEPKWVGRAVPDFTLKSLDGAEIHSTKLRGKVVVLNFWATWCGPCREEMPLIEKLRNELSSDMVEIWGVTDEVPATARRWLTERKRSLPTVVDVDRRLFRTFEVENIPVTLVIARDGRVSGCVIGLVGEQDLRAMIRQASQAGRP